MPNLYYLKYYDLLDKYLEECFLPICLHYREDSKYIGSERIHYPQFDGYTNYEDILTSRNITDAIKFLRKINYKLSEKLDEFWKEKGM